MDVVHGVQVSRHGLSRQRSVSTGRRLRRVRYRDRERWGIWGTLEASSVPVCDSCCVLVRRGRWDHDPGELDLPRGCCVGAPPPVGVVEADRAWDASFGRLNPVEIADGWPKRRCIHLGYVQGDDESHFVG